jgi:hypothetical protein
MQRRKLTRLGSRLFSASRPRQADVTLTVDGKEVTVPQGVLLLQLVKDICLFQVRL